MPDRDGYPTEVELARIRDWPGDDPVGWFAFIKTCWWAADWGWSEEEVRDANERWQRYHISTGGWSGNEEILGEMKKHFILWSRSWEQHRRGGHYIFTVPKGEPDA